MSAARDAEACRRLDRWLTAYLDDELDAVHTLDVEEHLQRCCCCREQVELMTATRASLRRVVCTSASAALRARICAAMVEERRAEDEAARALPTIGGSVIGAGVNGAGVGGQGALGGECPASDGRGGDPRLVKLRYVVPIAAAATLVLVLGSFGLRPKAATGVAVASAGSTGVGSTGAAGRPSFSAFESFLDDLVAAHAQPPPPEVTSDDDLDRFDPYVGVRVPKPRLTSVGAKFSGARIQNRAAMLQYLLRRRHRVTVYVFDAHRLPVSASLLSLRRYGMRHVYVGHLRGYTVAASQKGGVGMALASGLGDDESAELLMMAAR